MHNNIIQSRLFFLRHISLALVCLLFIATVQAQVPENVQGKNPFLGNYKNHVRVENVKGEDPPSHRFSTSTPSTTYLWDTQFATNGLNDDAYAMVNNGNDIYVGGDFTTAGGNTANHIAIWDGTQWDSVGGGVNNTVWALAVSGTDLYVGGSFTTAGGVTVNGIAKWNGSSWSALGTGVTGSVYALAINGTDIYVGGSFTTAGGVTSNGIAKWNGTEWSALGSGMDMAVFTLAVNGSTLYAGGAFTNAGGTSANYIAQWNGANWSALGTGLTFNVNTLLYHNSVLYVGGGFDEAGGIFSPGVARWNGSSWSAMGSGISRDIYALSAQGSKIYASEFEIHVWDGTGWNSINNNPDRAVFSLLAVPNDTVYAGGAFTATANTPSLHFGRFYPAGKALAIEERSTWWFGSWAIGRHFTLNMKVYNTGVGENVSISSVSSSLPDFTISPNTASVAPGDSFIFQVTFAPVTEGDLTSTITFTHDAYNSPSTVSVTGTGLPAPPPNYYRTARYEDWATAVDTKGKRAALKRKFDRVHFKFNLKADTVRPLLLDFGMLVKAVVTRGKTKVDTIAVITNVKKWTDSLLTFSPGETLQVDGIGYAGKAIKVKYQWGKKKAVTMTDASLYKLNQPGLPMPNLVNVGEELFPKGFGNSSAYFPLGLTIGIPSGAKSPNTVLHKKFADVQKSFVKALKNGIRLHSDTLDARCLDSLDGEKKKAIASQLSALPPDKQDNKLFAEAVTLKLNIAASAKEKFPAGLGELKYNNPDDTANSLNNQYVTTISEIADWMLSCQDEYYPTVTFQELYDVIRSINVAFADSPYTIDTLSFSTKTKLTGLKTLLDVNYLYAPFGVEPKIVFDGDYSGDNIPEEFSLQQNYPNPFNPTTNFGFRIANSGLVTLKVYNMLGQEVATILNQEEMEAGEYEFPFDASLLSSGAYFYRITAQGVDGTSFNDVKKMLLLR
jgi:hypothetical protein